MTNQQLLKRYTALEAKIDQQVQRLGELGETMAVLKSQILEDEKRLQALKAWKEDFDFKREHGISWDEARMIMSE